MCVTCGCGQGAKVRIDGIAEGEHEHVLADGTRVVHRHDPATDSAHAHANVLAPHNHSHDHAHGNEHAHSHEHVGPQPPAFVRVAGHDHDRAPTALPGTQVTELVRLETALLDKNRRIAERNRGWLAGRGVLALNLMSSPGAGKTSLLVRTLTDLRAQIPMAVVEGDQETSADAERIRATGARAVQINTGTGCHLEADMLERALHDLSPSMGSVLFVENVGNLVCPALFDLGEHARIVVLSVTEGDDKPLKYPHMFRSAQLMLLTKTDLLPHVSFDPERAEANARQINPDIQCMRLSTVSGDGLPIWYRWLREMQIGLTEDLAS
jgi:hydrogenase nickel incorporation protein HypB